MIGQKVRFLCFQASSVHHGVFKGLRPCEARLVEESGEFKNFKIREVEESEKFLKSKIRERIMVQKLASNQ